ncbi:MAG: trigger factor [Solirubrobacteraceae bacterium]|nr:MAG: trigger factor [Solirubrobacterales bacterium]
MPAVSAEVTELPESRVRVHAEVQPAEVQRRLNQTAQRLGRQLRVPGFRRGKVPPPVVIRRIGREAVLDEALRGALPSWYVSAIDAAGIITVGDPKLDLGELPAEGEAFSFSIEIAVRPTARLGDYRRLEVGRREPAVEDAAIDAQLADLREQSGTLETVERPAARGDFVVIDYEGSIEGEPFSGGEGRDQLAELGGGRLIPGFEEQLEGAAAGEQRTLTVDFPKDYGREELAGKTASFAVTVKAVQAKQLPELDDDFAADSAGFDSLEELREDIRGRLLEADEREIATQFREAALDAAVANAKIDVPDGLVAARAEELWEQLVSSLERQGISKEAYLRISNKSEEEIVAEAKPDAELALRREAVIAATVEAEQIVPSEEELEEALAHSAEHEKTTPAKLLRQLRDGGRLEPLRRELAARQAVDLIAESAKPIPVEQAKARDKLWTPDKAESAEKGASGRLWTPGQ